MRYTLSIRTKNKHNEHSLHRMWVCLCICCCFCCCCFLCMFYLPPFKRFLNHDTLSRSILFTSILFLDFCWLQIYVMCPFLLAEGVSKNLFLSFLPCLMTAVHLFYHNLCLSHTSPNIYRNEVAQKSSFLKFLLLLPSIVAQHIFWWHFFSHSHNSFSWTTFPPLFLCFNFLSFAHLNWWCMNVVHVRCNMFFRFARMCAVVVYALEMKEMKKRKIRKQTFPLLGCLAFAHFTIYRDGRWIWLSLASHFYLTLHEPCIFHRTNPNTKVPGKYFTVRWKSLRSVYSTQCSYLLLVNCNKSTNKSLFLWLMRTFWLPRNFAKNYIDRICFAYTTTRMDNFNWKYAPNFSMHFNNWIVTHSILMYRF